MNRKHAAHFCVIRVTSIVIAIGVLATATFSACLRGQAADQAQAQTQTQAQAQAQTGAGSEAGAVTRVRIATARTDSFPVYINALGNIAAWRTVTVRSRVDGTLTKLHFDGGERVKAGDLLAVITQDSTQPPTLSALTRITSPIDGVIGMPLIDEGNFVQASGTNNGIAIVTQDDPAAIFFSVPENNFPELRRAFDAVRSAGDGQAPSGHALTVDVYARSMQRSLGKGVVVGFDNQIDPNTGTMRVKARIDNASHDLIPNQVVNIRVLVNTLANVVFVPVDAVRNDGAGRFVFVVKPDQTVERRAVTTGVSDNTNTVITRGLAAGEQVVVDGLARLQNGARVIARQNQLPQ